MLQALAANALALDAGDPLNRATDLIVQSYQTDFPVLDSDGNYVGVLTKARLIQARLEAGLEAHVGDVMLAADQVPVCTPTGTLADVWEMMMLSGSRVVAIKEGPRFLGLMTLDDISRVFQVMHDSGTWRRRGGSNTPPPTSPQGAADA